MGTAAVENIPIIKRRRIKEIVVNILKDADWETASEFSVRAAAAKQLGDDLSDMASKSFIRQVLESYLLSTVQMPRFPSNMDASRIHEEAVVPQVEKETESKAVTNGIPESNQGNGRVICKLSDSRNVAICDFSGQPLVAIQDYHQIDGKQFPSGRGISLTGKEWSLFMNKFSAVEEAIAKMESRLRPAPVEKLLKANVASSEDGTSHQEHLVSDQKQMEASDLSALHIDPQRQDFEKVKLEALDTIEPSTRPSSETHVAKTANPVLMQNSTSWPSFPPQSHAKSNHNVNLASQSLVPIMTTRLNGKNYHSWVHQMDFFLRQIKLAYVLTLPCPIIPDKLTSLEEIAQAKAAAQKWIDDDYLCRHSILNSLSDNLFTEYSRTQCSAKELWEKLQSVYDEDFGTKRSLVNKYVQFEMVDGVSVVDQVQELNHIANTIMASGIVLDENFHVSVIISKLPPSWMAFRRKLMHEEHLPLNVLIHRVKTEESYNFLKAEEARNMTNSGVGIRVAPQKKDDKRVCFSCGKEGHISKYCHVKSNQKSNQAAPTCAEEHTSAQ